MSVNMFLKITGIDGESQKENHKNEIDITDFSFGATQTAAWHTGGAGGGAGKADITGVTISKRVCKASVNLFKACATGKHISDMTIYALKAGDGEQPMIYYTVKLTDVIISSFDNTAHIEGDSVLESVSLTCAKFEFEYQPQSNTGAKDGGAIKSFFDIRQNIAG